MLSTGRFPASHVHDLAIQISRPKTFSKTIERLKVLTAESTLFNVNNIVDALASD